jgi:multimeric flavodoxin WrbA
MKALVIGCTLKPSPDKSNSESIARFMADALEGDGVEVEWVRAADKAIKPGVETDMGEGDDWPAIHEQVTSSEILIIAVPTWLGQPSSISKLVLERMDAMISETDDEGRPIAYNRVAGVAVSGNEDGAHHVIAEINGALNDIGYTTPGQNWTYWNRGPGPGPEFSETAEGHEWTAQTAKAAASNLLAAAKALQANPIPAPPSS